MAVVESGKKVDEVQVQIGPQFLHLFSEQLYSSPNKALEELISNSWDADATRVYVNLPKDLSDPSTSIWVWDDGLSMDLDGLAGLWSVATSMKRHAGIEAHRNQIGKFGVGKLATYLLAHELTYVCRAADGVIRAVTMDYRRIDEQRDKVLHIAPLPLDVREVDPAELQALFENVSNNERLMELVVSPDNIDFADPEFVDEFGGAQPAPTKPHGTWTVAIMTALKPKGQALSYAWVRRLLRSALPLGNSISIRLGDEIITSAKSNVEVWREWKVGDDFTPDSLVLGDGTEIAISPGLTPYPSLVVDGIGEVTGTIKLYSSRITGGKSEEIEVSNGFFVNVLGRVLKPDDPYFGLQNLSHSAWAQFRATIRADGLDEFLTVNREGILSSTSLTIFRALLTRAFNTARNEYKVRVGEEWPDVGDLLVDKWGTAPLEPLRHAITDFVGAGLELPPFIRTSSDNVQEEVESWEYEISQNDGDVIENVSFVEGEKTDKFAVYDISSRAIRINRNHPFVVEHAESAEEQRLLRNAAVVDVLTDAYMLGHGVSVEESVEISQYKDRALRLIAQVSRKSAGQIAQILTSVTDRDKSFERIIGDALEYTGFIVDRLGASGEPEGVAHAVVSPMPNDTEVAYKFTYDAKSTLKGAVQTGNVGVAGLVRHRKSYDADYTLVVGPKFQTGALEDECKEHKVTPMLASDLAKLVMATAGAGPMDLKALETIFESYSPVQTTEIIDKLIAEHQAANPLSLGTLISALEHFSVAGGVPDTIHIAQVAERYRAITGNDSFPKREQVGSVLRGLQLVAPKAIQVTQTGDVLLTVKPDLLRRYLGRQLENVPEDLHFGLLKGATA